MQCPDHLVSAFLGRPSYVQLRPGTHLYKFVSIPIDRQRILASPWWIDQPTLDTIRLRASRLQKPWTDLARAQLAITTEWNPGMDTLYVIVLARPAHGWTGRATSQRVVRGDPGVVFTGGGNQLAVPDLEWQQIGVHHIAWSGR